MTAIFFTHGHPDHIAGASLCPNATLYADVALVEGREGSHVRGSRGVHTATVSSILLLQPADRPVDADDRRKHVGLRLCGAILGL
jgi:glyoxylase-like metal-dependent hydrolase (beta-lactamase superfamily II)